MTKTVIVPKDCAQVPWVKLEYQNIQKEKCKKNSKKVAFLNSLKQRRVIGNQSDTQNACVGIK